MTMIKQKDFAVQVPVFDLSGPMGNAFFMLSVLDAGMKSGGVTYRERREFQKNICKMEYTDRVLFFNQAVGDRAIIILPPELEYLICE